MFAFGEALGEDALGTARNPEVLIGADTRESGRWIAAMVAGGLSRRGVRARYAGIITTPGVAWLTRTGPFAAGVMISASHNPYQDNGIKVFSHSGFKLPDEEEHAIESRTLRLRGEGTAPRPCAGSGRGSGPPYLEYLRSTAAVRFDGMRLALDCGNGAAYRLAPELFRRLGAEVIAVGAEPDGRNINRIAARCIWRTCARRGGPRRGFRRGVRRRCRPRHLRGEERQGRQRRRRPAGCRARA